jgi:hypothetical protein
VLPVGHQHHQSRDVSAVCVDGEWMFVNAESERRIDPRAAFWFHKGSSSSSGSVEQSVPRAGALNWYSRPAAIYLVREIHGGIKK